MDDDRFQVESLTLGYGDPYPSNYSTQVPTAVQEPVNNSYVELIVGGSFLLSAFFVGLVVYYSSTRRAKRRSARLSDTV